MIINLIDDNWNVYFYLKFVLGIEKYKFFLSLIFKFLKYLSIVGFFVNRVKRWCLLKVDYNCI